MVNLVQSIFLGLVQGLTEFFPVSSSGQLVFFQSILGVSDKAMMGFDVMLHVGTLIALLLVFWKEFWGLFRPPFNRLLMLIAATIPAAIVGGLFQTQLNGMFTTAQWLPIPFLVTAALLIAVEIFSRKRPNGISFGEKRISVIESKNSEEGVQGTNRKNNNKENSNKSFHSFINKGWAGNGIGWNRTIIMSLAQAVAVVPGLSRSGTTIASGVLSGAQREKAAKFSFFMSIPIIAGTAFVSLIQAGTSGMSAIGAGPLLAGMLAAAVSGFFALELMLRLIRRNNFRWFAGYLIVLSAFIILNYTVFFLF